jgi:hypothetical protein
MLNCGLERDHQDVIDPGNQYLTFAASFYSDPAFWH